MYGSEITWNSYWWIFPIFMMILCFFMMRGRGDSLLQGDFHFIFEARIHMDDVPFMNHFILLGLLKNYPDQIGKAEILKEGSDVTIITYGAGVHWALETLEKHDNMEALLKV